MQTDIRRIDQLTALLKSMLPMSADNQRRLDNKFRLEFSFNSNHLEGNTLTYGETELLLIFGETKPATGHQFREYEEMKAHDLAFELIHQWAAEKERPLTEANIKNLNEIILVEPFWKDAITPDGQNTRRQIKVGNYKEFPNSVRLQNGEVFNYTSPADTPIAMGDLMAWYKKEEKERKLHPVELAALFHYKFVLIHPFDDGNGRISRLLMNYVLLRSGLPPVVIKANDKASYLQALHLADTGDLNAFIDYITRQLIWSLETSIKAAKGESIDEAGDLDKKIALLKSRVGDNPDEKVVEKKTPAAVKFILEGSVLPLAKAWETRLKVFDSFFFSRENRIAVDNEIKDDSDLNNLVISQLNLVTFPRLSNHILPTKIQISSVPKGIRRINKEMSLNGGKIDIYFWEQTYEVEYTNNAKPINKLYHQSLSKEEIDSIVETLGTFLYNIVSQTIGE